MAWTLMPHRFPKPKSHDEAHAYGEIEREDRRNLKRDQDIEPQGGARIILRSPDGTRYAITIANGGAISTTPVA